MKRPYWLWLIWLAGCNLQPGVSPVATPTRILTPPANATRLPTFTPIPTYPAVEPSEKPVDTVTLMPSATFTQSEPVTLETRQEETPQPGPLRGSVVLQGGLCCIGGVVGTKVNLRKEFVPPGSFGTVIEMRRKEGMFCSSGAEMVNAPWEPFVVSVTEPYTITAINWIGHFISVQYRDNLGNISSVVCDDISVEGMPAPPKP